MTDDPQAVAEQFDEDMTDPDLDDFAQDALFDAAPDEPVAVEEEVVTEPIVDSVASRDDRLQPEAYEEAEESRDDLASVLEDDPDLDVGDLAGDPVRLSPEEAALHVIDDSNLG